MISMRLQISVVGEEQEINRNRRYMGAVKKNVRNIFLMICGLRSGGIQSRMSKNRMAVKKMTSFGMLIALAFIFSYLESLLPLQLPVPGMKLGLANIVVVMALYCWGEKEAFVLSAVRILLVSLTFGNMAAMIYSLAGGALSLLMMIVVRRMKWFDTVGVSIVGGVFHNVGQIVVAIVILETQKLLYYLPVLVVSGVVTGALIGIAGGELVKRLKKILRMS